MRPGGNPDLKAYQYKTDRKEPLTAQLVVKTTHSMLERLKSQENWQKLVREAIAEKLEELEQENSLQKTE